MERLTQKTIGGKWVYVQRADSFQIDDDEKFIVDKAVIIHKGEHIDRLAYFEDLRDMVKSSCERCRVDGYYAEWSDCGDCGFQIWKVN